MGKFVRMITESGSAVCYSVDTTDIAAKAESIHKTSAVVTAALGRLMTAASIIGAGLKGEKDSVTLRIAADGPAGVLIAVADSNGDVKGYVENPVVELPLNEFSKLDVSGAVGKNGYLYVVKDIGLKEPHIGMVPLVSGEIAEDITSYFATSEQIPTVCALGVLVNPDLTVKAAGGYIVQLLPGSTEEDIEKLEKNIENIESVTQMLSRGMSPQEIGEKILNGMNPHLLDTRTVEYRCDCNRGRVRKALESIEKEELVSMLQEEGKADIQCHFCNASYHFDGEELAKIIAEKG